MSEKKITVTIDDRKVEVSEGTTILEACREHNIKIPTLCYHDDLCVPSGNCRLCVVDVEGQRVLQTSCTFPCADGLEIKTSTPEIRHARRDILELIMSEHYGECTTCGRSGTCELQNLCEDYNVNTRRFGEAEEPRFEEDASSPSIVRDMDKCVLCRRCINTCAMLQGVGAMTVEGRGNDSKIAAFMNSDLSDTLCIYCGQCVNRCPTGALTEKDYSDEVWKAIEDPDKFVVIQTAPAPRAAIGELFGVEPGIPMTWQMNTALKRCGFDKVFDTNFSADLTIMEEGTELITRLYKALVKKDKDAALPQFTSCSPGWVKFIEQMYPEYLPNVSTAKSPQQMMGALIKTYFAEKNGWDPSKIVSVSLMPCTAKKFEAARPEMNDSGYQDVDYVLTTREVARMIKEAGIDLPNVDKSEFDDPFGTATGSGVIFGATGGVMEAALRTVIEIVTGKKIEDLYEHADIVPLRGFEESRIAEVTIDEVGEVPDILKHLVPDWNWLKGATLKVGITHGTINAAKVMEDIKNGGPFSECHFIEFMACPGGCLGGGGQPIPTTPEIRQARAKAIYAEDADSKVRKSHENPQVLQIYGEFLKDGPCGHKSHDLLHTHYVDRSPKAAE